MSSSSGLVFATFLLSMSACSLVADSKAEQCTSTADCAPFGKARCDLATFTCKEIVPPVADGAATVAADGGTREHADLDAGPRDAPGLHDAGASLDGGVACRKQDQAPGANACTNARCRPFDNRERLVKLSSDGGLPPLPPPRDAGAEVR